MVTASLGIPVSSRNFSIRATSAKNSTSRRIALSGIESFHPWNLSPCVSFALASCLLPGAQLIPGVLDPDDCDLVVLLAREHDVKPLPGPLPLGGVEVAAGEVDVDGPGAVRMESADVFAHVVLVGEERALVLVVLRRVLTLLGHTRPPRGWRR